jgi:hypothetical protein
MKSYFCGVVVALALAAPVRADESLDELKKQMQQMQQQMLQMQEKINELEKKQEAPVTTPAEVAGTAAAPSATVTKSWSPSDPIRWGGTTAYLNLSLDAIVAFGWSTDDSGELQTGGHAPASRGFSVPSVELALEGAVDPYFRGAVYMAMAVTPEGETEFELEEVFGQTVSLPWNFQLKAGQFLAAFGRHNVQHVHAWSFVDQPLVSNQMFGPEGLRNPGLQLSWLAPTPWYSELIGAVFNGGGEGAYSFRNGEGSTDIAGGEAVGNGLGSAADLMWVPRWVNSFDLTRHQTAVIGVSGAFGANDAGENSGTQIYGADFYWKWQPERAQRGFPFVSLQSEIMYRVYDAPTRISVDDPTVTLPATTLRNWGMYAQLLYGFHPGWVAGFRGDYTQGDPAAYSNGQQSDWTRLSPVLTWYPTEFSKVRWQYNYDYRSGLGGDHGVWMELEFLVGAHAAHKF